MSWIQRLVLLVFVPFGLLISAPTRVRSGSLPLNTILDVKIIEEGPVTFSPDGKWVGYVVRNILPRESAGIGTPNQSFECSGLYPDSHATDIDVSNVLTGETVSVGQGKGNNWMPAWSPDGRYLAFLSDRDGSGQAKLWLWETGTRSLRSLSSAIIRANQISWTANSQTILTTIWSGAVRPEDTAACKGNESTKMNPSKRSIESSSVVVYEGGQGRQSQTGNSGADPWDLNSKIRDLVDFDVPTGRMKRLAHGIRISVFRLSPNGAQVAFTTATRFEEPGAQQILYDLRVVERATDEMRVASAGIRLGFSGSGFTWSPDSQRLAFQASGVLEKTGDCYLVNADGSESRNLTSLRLQKVYSPELPPFWDEPRQQVYFIRDHAIWKASTKGVGASELARIPGRQVVEIVGQDNEPLRPIGAFDTIIALTDDSNEKQSGFYRVNPENGESSLLQEAREHYKGVSREYLRGVAPRQGTVVYSSQSAAVPPDLWASDLNFKNRRRLTHINPTLDKYEMGPVELIHWYGLDGEELSGALLLPADYDKHKTYPLLVWVYGGVYGSVSRNEFGLSGFGGPYNMQLFATRGYAVLAPDAPQHLGAPMLDLAKTVLPGVDRVVEMGIADPNRVGIMGHSYGGYSVLSLIVQTTRFKAALVSDGFGDLVSAYGQMKLDGSAYQTTTAERGQGLMGGTPWEFRDRYIENSPIFYLDRVKTPVLIVHGGSDSIVFPYLGDQVFVALRRLGLDVVYAKYVGENHSPLMWSRENQRDLGNRMLAWFDKFLGSN